MNAQVHPERLWRQTQAEEIAALSFPQLVALFQEELRDFRPDGAGQVDPRTGDPVLFNASRARRPHDNRLLSAADRETPPPCIVCQGQTTGVVDVAALSEGFTFINKNLYPSLFPLESDGSRSLADRPEYRARSEIKPYGLHLLQWTSSFHDRDWHNMPLADRAIVLRRLAVLEEKLLAGARAYFNASGPARDPQEPAGYVLIIKNYGHLVGGSLVHGHQQIALSNVRPRRIDDNVRFERAHGEKFSSFVMRENPAELLLRDYGPASLMVPYFMRRPYDMLLLLRDARKQHLFELTTEELEAVAEGWRDALRAIRAIMPESGREIAYNVVTHNGPGAGLYFEFLPYTQELGGFEHLGLWVCQSAPREAADRIRFHLA